MTPNERETTSRTPFVPYLLAFFKLLGLEKLEKQHDLRQVVARLNQLFHA